MTEITQSMEHQMKLRISSSLFLLSLSIPAFASYNQVEPVTISPPAKFYIGIFGGGGSSNNINASQFAAAFLPAGSGGTLAVNAFGQMNSQSSGFFGGQLGYQTQQIVLQPSSPWTLGPAVELEGYSMNSSTFSGILVNSNVRAPEHDFQVSYPMNRTLFFANGVLNFNNSNFPVHPYIGLGLGNALVRISGANATQINPAEIGINHYNSNPSDTNSVFAGQVKLGLSYDFNKYVSAFVDYRWVYVASTHFLFGSTIYTGHAETTSWQVKLDAQRYNLGNIGLRLNLG